MSKRMIELRSDLRSFLIKVHPNIRRRIHPIIVEMFPYSISQAPVLCLPISTLTGTEHPLILFYPKFQNICFIFGFTLDTTKLGETLIVKIKHSCTYDVTPVRKSRVNGELKYGFFGRACPLTMRSFQIILFCQIQKLIIIILHVVVYRWLIPIRHYYN